MKATKRTALIGVAIGILMATSPLYAHCDTVDGPVVGDARAALEKGDVTPVLKWVGKEQEKEIREAFALTLKVRSQGAEAKRLAEHFFFETLVRVHRLGEGVSYTGLKPAGTIEPLVAAADKALAQGTADQLTRDITKAVQEGIRARFERVSEKRRRAEESVESGRAYVAAYAEYVHFVESVHALASAGAEPQRHLHEPERHVGK